MSIKRVVLALLAAGMVFAASAATAQEAERHKLLREFEKTGGKVDFLGHAYGMDGWIITNQKGGVQYAYTTPEGALVLGMMFSPDGKLETKNQLQAYQQKIAGAQEAAPGAENSSVRAEKIYAETEKAAWVTLGSSQAPYLYVFMNVGCDHCQMYWKDIEGAVSEGKLQVRLVPFGAAEGNRDGGAALLSAENPEQAWRAYLAGDKSALAKDKIKEGAYQRIDANTTLAKRWPQASPPFTLYRSTAGGRVIAIVGRPENTMLLMADLIR